ncbi:hypothetical protein GGR58DRAFT_526275 [Xylaria digitata]|nr:hypothetical protein GGR58DRAFT_526275 [Xylaria digitata]
MSFYQRAKELPWNLSSNPAYSSIQSETEESSIVSTKPVARDSHNNQGKFLQAAALVLVISLWTALAFWVGSRFETRKDCALETASWSPALSVVHYHDVEIRVGGVPIRLDDSDLVFLNKSSKRSWTRIPESRGGGIAGYPEVFHQLHCLNMLRMASYPDHYANHSLFSESSPRVVRTHIDHCVEIIRMQLECSAEMTPILTEEIPGFVYPKADFNVIHKCKNFDDLFSWTKENVLHGAGNWDIPTFPKEHGV